MLARLFVPSLYVKKLSSLLLNEQKKRAGLYVFARPSYLVVSVVVYKLRAAYVVGLWHLPTVGSLLRQKRV